MNADWARSAVFVGVMAVLLAATWAGVAAWIVANLIRGARRLDEIDLRERMEPYTNVRVLRTESASTGHITQTPIERGDAS